MGYFENNIYIQTASSCIKNKDILNVNTSSDFCVFASPTYTMSGASKVVCNSADCAFSAQPYNDMITGATDTCFTQQSLSATCLEMVHWKTKISEDGDVVYSADFHTAITSGDTPTDVQFTGSVITAFDTLGYDYSTSGSTFTIQKPYGTTELAIDICINFDLTDDCVYTTSGCTACPSGYTETPAGDSCVYSATTAATFNGSGATIVAGDTNNDYSTNGAYFYTNETNNESKPLYRLGSNPSTLTDQSGGTITWTNISSPANTFWDSNGSTSNGRLNNTSLSGSSTEWLGFSDCIEIVSGGTYYIGIGADNYCRFSIDGELFLSLSATTDKNHKIWHVLPYEFSSGKHIIEMEGRNSGGASGFGAEIYNPVDLATLTGATTTGDTGLIFSTADKIGDYYDIGATIGYSCPTGWALDLCGMSAVCTELIYTAKTGGDCISGFTGTCAGTCTNVCTEPFSAITTANTSVHLVTTATTQDITFDLTGETSAFVDNNTTFKYEIYSFDTDSLTFHAPPQYVSGDIEWSSFSGTSALTQTISLSDLNIDGDYLIKGYFVHDVCTDLAGRLGYKGDTSTFKTGESFGLYEPTTDFYMSIFREADTPTFDDNGGLGGTLTVLKQQVVIPEAGQEVFILSDDVQLDFIVTLNGLVLANGLDYTIGQFTGGTNPYTVTMSGAILSTDIVTFIYGSNGSTGLHTDTFNVTSIPTGPTDGEGTNDVYYNTSTGKFEAYLTVAANGSDAILVMLNGVTLANGVDYYQSISNPKRIIFEGTILVGDTLVIAYNQNAEFIGSINVSNPIINWEIENAPTLVNGVFTLEFATDEGMSSVTSSSTTVYVVGDNSYSSAATISGTVGTQLYYRVTNTKDYVTICGDVIQSVAYSEVIPITIATNSINSY